MAKTARDILLLTSLSLLLFFGNLGSAPLWDRDEPRNAGCAAEMLAANDYVVPVFNNELRTHKPIMLYWLMMASYTVFGINEFGARAVSASASVVTVLLTYGIGRHLFGRTAAFWSGLILASTIMFSLAARAATPDALLICCGTLAVYFFVRGSFDASQGATGGMPRGVDLYGMYAAMGLGVLVKGPVGLVLPMAVLGMYLLIENLQPIEGKNGRFQIASVLRPFHPAHFLNTCWQMRPFTALLIVGAVAVPWYAWVHFRTNGVWTNEFFWVHNVSRASATMEGHAGPPILFYVVAILVGFFPWSVLAIPTGMQTLRDLRRGYHHQAQTLLLCWVGVYIALFSIAQTKLPSYITPCYPAVALVVGQFISQWNRLERFPVNWLKVGMAHWIGLGLIFSVALPLAASHWLPGSQWLGAIGLVTLLGGCICWRLLANENTRGLQATVATTAIAFIAFLMMVVPAEVGRHRNDRGLFTRIQRHPGAVVSFGHLEPSWVFYGGKPIREFSTSRLQELSQFLSENPDALLITTEERRDALFRGLPGMSSFAVAHRTDYFLRDRQLVLLTHDAQRMADGRNDLAR